MILRFRVLLLICCWETSVHCQVSFTPKTAVLFPGHNVTFMCNEPNKYWLINDTTNRIADNELADIDGVTSTGPQLLTLVITRSANDTLYGCGVQIMGRFSLDTGVVYVATAPNRVPTLLIDAVTLEDGMVNITLSWGEPFNNFDPIINYTVMCSGDDQCPEDVTTLDNTTRSYTITNLTTMTTYTFSVVATNSIGSGEAGVLMITAPSLPSEVTGVMLTCEAVDQINQCMVEWGPITVGNSLLEQPLVYEVYYNGTMINVTGLTTQLTFTAPSLRSDVFADNITVTVTAINRFGPGSSSDPEEFEIMAPSVIEAVATLVTPHENRTEHSITVTCTVRPESDADVCVVMAMDDGRMTRSGMAAVTNGMATVTIDGLECEVTYTITAGGTLNEALVGPRSSHGTITSGPCPPPMPTPSVATPSMNATPSSMEPIPTGGPSDASDGNDDDGGGGDNTGSNTGAIVGGVVGGLAGAILLILPIILILLWFYYIRKRGEKSSIAGSVPESMTDLPLYDTEQDPA